MNPGENDESDPSVMRSRSAVVTPAAAKHAEISSQCLTSVRQNTPDRIEYLRERLAEEHDADTRRRLHEALDDAFVAGAARRSRDREVRRLRRWSR